MKDTQSRISGLSMVDESASEINGQYLLFDIDRQVFAVPIKSVLQILDTQPVTAIPEYPEYVLGILHLRGQAVPVINMRIRLRRPPAEADSRSCIIILMAEERPIGLLVDRVEEVRPIQQTMISNIPWLFGDESKNYLLGVAKQDEQLILLLDTQKLLTENELELVSADDITI